jgi:hypothetical protein
MPEKNNKSINSALMHQILLESLSSTYGERKGSFRNESDFKMELFHQLAAHRYNSISLADKSDNAKTCYLHSEGKCENGNPSKADILICNPYTFQKFNYVVDYIIELKHKLYIKDIKTEIKKISKYKNKYNCIYLISAKKTNINFDHANELVNSIDNKIVIIQPDMVLPSKKKHDSEIINFNDALNITYDKIDEVLASYANGLQQYHGFYWCNYEHEENKRQTYPCEGDFVCQLYHKLRTQLPSSLNILSEVTPKNTRNRIDLAIISKENKWCIPIDVKMNWDQFKHKYDQNNGSLKQAEASLISERFFKISKEYEEIRPITIVIQGDLAQKSDKKERSMQIFKNSKIEFDLICYNEKSRNISKQSLGKNNNGR